MFKKMPHNILIRFLHPYLAPMRTVTEGASNVDEFGGRYDDRYICARVGTTPKDFQRCSIEFTLGHLKVIMVYGTNGYAGFLCCSKVGLRRAK